MDTLHNLVELERRERERPDRQPGLAREQFTSIHEHVLYDIVVDTSNLSLRECAEQIKSALASGAYPTAVDRLKAGL